MVPVTLNDARNDAVSACEEQMAAPPGMDARDLDEVENAIRKVISESRFDHHEEIETGGPDLSETASRRRWIRFRNGNPERMRVAFPPSPLLAAAQDRVLRYRPRWRHTLALFALAALIYSPVGTLFGFGVVMAIVASLYFLIGPDRIGRRAQRVFDRYEQRNPDKAALLLHRGNELSARMERWSERLPERWTQGLYFPSFERDEHVPEKLAQDPFERLKSQLQDARPGPAT